MSMQPTAPVLPPTIIVFPGQGAPRSGMAHDGAGRRRERDAAARALAPEATA